MEAAGQEQGAEASEEVSRMSPARMDREDQLSRSVGDMLEALEAPAKGLRDLVAQGAHQFDTPRGRRDEIASAVAEIARIVRDARTEALRWTNRVERRAAGPIGLDRLERIEDFLGRLDEFRSWAGEMAAKSGRPAFDGEWRRLLLEAYERVLYACRAMRRALATGI